MSYIVKPSGDLPRDKFLAQLRRDADKRAEAAELRAATAEVWEL